MAVTVRLRAGAPAKASGAAFTLVATPIQATGGASGRARTRAFRPQVPLDQHLPYTEVPPGPTNGHSQAVPYMRPWISVVPPSLPRLLPEAGWRAQQGLSIGTTVPVIGQVGVASSLRPAPRVGGGAARVTPPQKPRIRWKAQGG